jgi:hypothetical protein
MVLACWLLPTLFRVLDQTIVKAARLFGTPPPTRLISPRSVERFPAPAVAPCPLPFLPPASLLWRGVGSYRADATEAARDRRAYAALSYRDEGLVVQMGILFASPVRGRTINLPTSRVGRKESVVSGQKAKSLHFKRCYRHSRYASSSSSVYSHHPAVRVSLSLDDTGTDMCTHVMSWASFTSRALRRAQTCGIT